MHLGEFAGPAGRFRQRTETTPDQHAIFKALQLTEPRVVVELAPAPSGR
jgi:hypothetical protein